MQDASHLRVRFRQFTDGSSVRALGRDTLGWDSLRTSQRETNGCRDMYTQFERYLVPCDFLVAAPGQWP